jgi:hypothetical protein
MHLLYPTSSVGLVAFLYQYMKWWGHYILRNGERERYCSTSLQHTPWLMLVPDRQCTYRRRSHHPKGSFQGRIISPRSSLRYNEAGEGFMPYPGLRNPKVGRSLCYPLRFLLISRPRVTLILISMHQSHVSAQRHLVPGYRPESVTSLVRTYSL